MAENRVTFEVWTWPHTGVAVTKKFPITAYITDYEFTAEYGIGSGDGVLQLDPTFARLTEILNRDYATPANDHASIIMVCKDGVPYRPYVAARLPKTISSGAKSVPLTLRSMAFFLDKANVGPFDHNPLVIDSANPNPTLDPDWEYGAESVLRFGDNISNEVQQIWRSVGMSSGTFTLKQSNNATESSAIAWNATTSQVQTAAQELPDVVDVTVSGDGTDVAPWEFEFLDPSGDIAFTLEIGTNTTDGSFSTDTLREGGSLDPSPWTQSLNPVTKVVHGNYQIFDVVDNTIAPVAAFPAGDTHVLRVDVDSLGELGTDYGGAQQIVAVEGGARWRAGCFVYSPGEAKRFRIVVRSMDEQTAYNSKDFDVPADTLFFLDMPAINFPAGVSEVIYRIGILEPTNVGVAYIAIQSAILAPGFPPRPWGYIVNELLVDINFRTSLQDWVTVTWSGTLDSSGAAWDRDLSWEISLRQSLQQLCEISHEWGYESTGIYYNNALSRFEWGCFNAGSGGVDRTSTGFKIGMGDAMQFGEKVSRVPEVTSAWAFGHNLKWGRANDATMVSKWGVLESMALDRQGQDTMDALATQMVADSELESAVQKIRIHFARITPGIDFDIGDFLDIDMGPVGIAGIFRVAGIVEGKTEDGEEYADIHLGALVKSSEVAQADAVRILWRKLEVIEGERAKSRVVNPFTVSPPDASVYTDPKGGILGSFTEGRESVPVAGSTITFPLPASVGVGHQMYLAAHGTTTVTAPAGWTTIVNEAGLEGSNNITTAIFRKVADASDTPSSSKTFDAGANASGASIGWTCWAHSPPSGVDYSTAIPDFATSGTTIQAPATSPGIDPAAEGKHWVFAVAMGSAVDETEPSGYIFVNSDPVASSRIPHVAYREVTFGPTDVETPGAWGQNGYGFTLASLAGGTVGSTASGIHSHVEADVTDLNHVVTVAKAGTLVGTRSRLNLIEGSNVTLGVVDDAGSDEIDVTINASGGGGGGGTAPEWVSYLAERQTDETAHADDDFFDDGTKTGLTELAVAGTAVWTEARGRLAVKALSGATGDASVALKAITATGPPLSIETAVMPDLVGADFFLYGICFTDGTVAASNVAWIAMLARATGVNNIQVATGTLTAISGSTKVSYSNTAGNHRGLTYFRLVQTAANTWAANYSTNGVTWHDMGLAPFAFTMTPTHFGPFIAQYNSTTVPLMASWEYLRMYETSLDV